MTDEEYPFAKKLITDAEGKRSQVVIDFNDYQRLLEVLEDYGLLQLMHEVKDEKPLSRDEALQYLKDI